MKKIAYRVAALGLALLLCAATASAQTADDVSYTMAEKFVKQLEYGSGFQGTLTITSLAVDGRESDAVSTILPIVMDVSYIQQKGTDAASAESRLNLSIGEGEAQQGSAEFSLQGGDLYAQSSLLDGGWYLLGTDVVAPLLNAIGVQGMPSAVSELTQATGLMPGTSSFVSDMISYLMSANTSAADTAAQAYLTEIDFWLESYREDVRMITLDNGASAMEISYRLPPEVLKAQLKQLIQNLMNDEAFLEILTAMMSAEQAALYLDPQLQPYYFYAVDGLPLEDDLTVRRVLNLKGDTLELQVVMPFYDSVSGAATLSYTRVQDGADVPFDNTLSLQSQQSYLELNYRSQETANGTTAYQGTLLSKNAEADGTAQPAYWAAFDLSIQSQTTKDLNGYETQYQTVKLSVEPAAVPDGEDASGYAVFSKTNLALDMKFSSLATKTSPTNADIALTVSGDGMAQTVTLGLTGATTSKWTPAAFDAAQAADLSQLPAEELQSLLSRAVVKGGILFLPYINLPQITNTNVE